jgi:hypothetical protein
VVEVEGALGLLLLDVHVEREQRRALTTRPTLGEGAEARPVVVVSTDSTEAAEVVVERPVLVHQVHDVLDRTEVGTRRRDSGGRVESFEPEGRRRGGREPDVSPVVETVT